MSEFAAILQIVAKVASATFEITVDIICGLLLAISVVAVWRIPEIVHLYIHDFRPAATLEDQRYAWRQFALNSITLSVADFFALPLTLLALISPLRWAQLRYSFQCYFSTRTRDWGACMELRGWCSWTGCLAMFDACCWVLGCFILVSPLGRIAVVLSMVRRMLLLRELEQDREIQSRINMCSERATTSSKFVGSAGLSSLIDFCTLILPVLVAALVPSVWPCLFAIIAHVRARAPRREVGVYNQKTEFRAWSDLFIDCRFQVLFQLPHALIDMVLFPCLLLGALSPLRNGAIRRLFGCCLSPKHQPAAATTASAPSLDALEGDVQGYEPPKTSAAVADVSGAAVTAGPIGTASASNDQPAFVPGSNDFNDFDFHYSLHLRYQVLQLGVLAIGDLLILPMLLPLFAAQYRYRQLRAKLLQRSDAIWGLHELYLVASQCSLQFLDAFILLPALPLLYCTSVRWAPVEQVLKLDSCFLEHSLDLYAAVGGQCGLLLLDLLLLPFTLLVLATNYRSEPLQLIWKHAQLWHAALLFHGAVLANFGVLLHDVLLLTPVLLLCCIICPYRAPAMYHILCEGLKEHNRSRQEKQQAFEVLQQQYLQKLQLLQQLQQQEQLPSAAPISAPVLVPIPSPTSTPMPPATETPIPAPPATIVRQKLPADAPAVGSALPTTLTSRTAEAMQIENDAYLAALLSDDAIPTVPKSAHLHANIALTPAGATSAPLDPPVPEVIIASGMKERVALWAQALWTLLDLPFELMCLVVICTLWRARELFLIIGDILTKTAATTPHWRRCEFRESNRLRVEIGKEFFYLLRDVLCLVPMILILCTLWRALQLLTSFVSRMAACALLEEPEFMVTSCHCEFPERGGPKINLQLRRASAVGSENLSPEQTISSVNNVAAATATAPAVSGAVNVAFAAYDGTSADADAVANAAESVNAARAPRRHTWIVDPKRPPELHILSASLWGKASEVFGSMLVSVVKSFMPLKLIDEENIGWGNFVGASLLRDSGAADASAAVDVAGGPVLASDAINSGRSSVDLSLWLRLDFGTTKRSTLIKKLRLLGGQRQLCIQIEAAHRTSDSSATQKAVVMRLSFPLSGLISLIEQGSGLLSSDAFSSSISPNERAALADQRANRFVNIFHVVVLQVALEWALDVAHLLLFIVAIVSPVRWIRMVVALLEPATRLPMRLCNNAMRAAWHLDRHILEFRSGVAPVINELLKQMVSGPLQQQQQPRHLLSSRALFSTVARFDMDHLPGVDRCWKKQQLEAVRDLEAEHLWAYRRLRKQTLNMLSLHADCSPFVSLMQERMQLHDRAISCWFKKSVAKYNALIMYAEQRGNSRVAAVSEVCAQEHDSVIRQIASNGRALKERMEQMRAASFDEQLREEPDASTQQLPQDPKKKADLWKSLKKRCGLLVRPLSMSRLLIRQSAMQALTDVGFAFLLLLLLLSLVRTVPLLQDLHQHRTLSLTRYDTRVILIKHVSRLAADLYYCGKFTLFALLVLLSVGGIPAFLSELLLSGRVHSLREAANCAQQHAKKFFFSLLRILVLLVEPRTYRVLVKSTMFCVLVPGACIAEALPSRGALSTTARFAAGMAVWVALLVGAVFAALAVHRIGVHDGDARDATDVLLIFSGVLLVILMAATVSVSCRPHYNSFDKRSVSVPSLTWSHILALLTGPLEALQLSAVVLFFFWRRSDSSSDKRFGLDGLSSHLLLWGAQGGGERGYRISGSVAAVLVVVWALLVSLPLAVGGAEPVRRQAKVLAFKGTPLYEALLVLISRLLTVWIIATLMRPASCYSSDSSTVMSTEHSVRCGGGDAWYADSAIALLAFFIVTSAVLHADDADLLHYDLQQSITAKLERSRTVKFAPLYAMAVRCVQLFVCAACMGGFQFRSSSLTVLLAVAIASVMMMLLPTLIPRASSGMCSFASVVYIRSAGFACVAWTALVCAAQESSSSNSSSVWNFEGTVYLGWGVLFMAAALIAAATEHIRLLLWRRAVCARGLAAAVDGVLRTYRSALLLDITHSGLLQQESRGGDAGGDTPAPTDDTKASALLRQRIENEICYARDAYDLSLIVARVESLLLFEKLSEAFLSQRTQWLQELKLLGEEERGTSDSEMLVPYPNNASAVRQLLCAVNSSSYCGCCWMGRTTGALATERSPAAQVTGIATDYGALQHTADSFTASAPPPTPAFQRLLQSITALQRGLQPQGMLTDVSRVAFTILLTNRGLPQEICWSIYGYLVDARFIREIILMPRTELSMRFRNPEDQLAQLASNSYSSSSSNSSIAGNRSDDNTNIIRLIGQMAAAGENEKEELLMKKYVRYFGDGCYCGMYFRIAMAELHDRMQLLRLIDTNQHQQQQLQQQQHLNGM